MASDNLGIFEPSEEKKHEDAVTEEYMKSVSLDNWTLSAFTMRLIERAFREGFRRGRMDL